MNSCRTGGVLDIRPAMPQRAPSTGPAPPVAALSAAAAPRVA
jgi:hypothetical protein